MLALNSPPQRVKSTSWDVNKSLSKLVKPKSLKSVFKSFDWRYKALNSKYSPKAKPTCPPSKAPSSKPDWLSHHVYSAAGDNVKLISFNWAWVLVPSNPKKSYYYSCFFHFYLINVYIIPT